jgi:glycosyltransferase involved in cell wall biosynthesis
MAAGIKRKILLVTPASPFDRSSGAHQRTYLLYRALQASADVDVVILQPGNEITVEMASAPRAVEATVPERQDLRRFAPNRLLTEAVERALGRAAHDYDVVVGRYIWPVTQLAIPSYVPVIVDLDDFRYRYGRDAGCGPGVLFERTRKSLSHRLARRTLTRFRAAFFASRLDQTEVDIDNLLLPNVPLHVVQKPDFRTCGEQILFVGSLWYRPNRDGVDWFLRRVWPQVLKARPGATLRLVGAATADLRQAWMRYPRVQAPGFVDDIAAEYANAAVIVAPIHSGGGSNIKILEALAQGRACVTTAFCLDAFGNLLRNQADILAAGDAGEFTSHCLALLDDRSRSAELARHGHATVLTNFTTWRFDAVVDAMLERVLAQRGLASPSVGLQHGSLSS